jgi:hypothetical protein
LSFRFQGLDFRLTGVEQHHAVKKLIAWCCDGYCPYF